MSAYKVRSVLAMKIAHADRQKFNEAVAGGMYPCAPETMRGSSRIFDEDDVIGLTVFSRLIDLGLTPRMAGSLACNFMSTARNAPDEDRIVYVKGANGVGHFFTGSNYDPDIEKKGRHYSMISPVVYSIDFNVGEIRKKFRTMVEEERMIIGPDEE